MNTCRGCRESSLIRVLDLGKVPAADYFPPASDPPDRAEACHALAMDLCTACGLAQLTDDDTITTEPRGIEPQALRDQAAAAVEQVTADGWLLGDLYGGTVLLAAMHGTTVEADESVLRVLSFERAIGATDPAAVSCLQRYADEDVESLRNWLEGEAEAGRSVFAYGAASRAVAVFSRGGIDAGLLAAVADASPAKQGRRMPGTDIPIVAPEELLAAQPARVLLTLPDLLPEVSARFPELDGRWMVDGQWPAGRRGSAMRLVSVN